MYLQNYLSGYELTFSTAQNSVESSITSNPSPISAFNGYTALFVIAILLYLLKNIKPIEIKIHWLVAIRNITQNCKNIFWQWSLSVDLNEAVAAATHYDASIFPRPVQLRHVHNVDHQTVCTNSKKVRVYLKRSYNEDVNFVHAAGLYVERGFIPSGKTILHPKFTRACNLVMVRKIVEASNNRCREYFLGPYFNQYIGGDQEVFNLYCELLEADKRGILIPILAYQAENIAFTTEYSETDSLMKKDFLQLIRRLHQVVSSNNTRDINTSVFNRYLRVSVFSFYHFDDSLGPQHVFDQLLKRRNEGYTYIYLLSIENSPATVQSLLSQLSSLSKEFISISVKKNQTIQIDGYTKQTVCIEFHS